ncbi:MAG TPA: ABC transporter substrate-binding protein [Candidatus Binatia bacterium]|jgi:NitT/TauT family transport system substrate-binding protein
MKLFATALFSSLIILSAAPDVRAQKSATTVRLGVAGISGTNAHPFVDRQLGLYQKHNIDMELIAFQGGSQLIQAMLAGDLPLALSEGVTALATNIKGGNLYFIAGLVNTFPFTIISKAEIRTPADLRGKKIAISRFGSSSDVAVRHAVERYDLKPDKDVIILQVGGQAERFAALRAGVVDAAIVSPPFNLVGRRLGFNDLIDMSEQGVAYAHQQIVARKDFLDRQPDVVLRFLRGTIEGIGYWKDPSKRDAVTQNVAKFLKLDPQKDKDQLDETFRYYGKVFPTKPYPTLEGLELSANILKKARPDAKDLQAKDFVVNRFVGELEKEGFLAKVFGGR